MSLEDLQKRNKKFQEITYGITNLMPDKNLLEHTSNIIRSAKRLDSIFPKLLSAKTEVRFNTVIDKLEEEMDDIVIALDFIAEQNKKWSERYLNDFVKYGYDLLSIYSMGCDKIIEKRVINEA